MSAIEAKLQEMGIELPDSPAPMANYVPAVRTGNLLYLAGLGPAARPDGTSPTGKVGQDLSVEEGTRRRALPASTYWRVSKGSWATWTGSTGWSSCSPW